MFFVRKDKTFNILQLQIYRRSQIVLKKCGFWPSLNLKLSYEKLKCFYSEVIINLNFVLNPNNKNLISSSKNMLIN